VLFVAGLAVSPADAKPSHQAAKKVPARPARFAKNYKLDDELSERSTHGNSRQTTRVIVTLVPGATLPAEFKRYALNSRLDLINGEVLDLPNGVLKQIAAHPNVFRVLLTARPKRTTTARR